MIKYWISIPIYVGKYFNNFLFTSAKLIPLRLIFKILKKQKEKMKKVFAMLAITSLMVACNNSGESKEATTDTTTTAAPAADTTMAPAAADTTAKPAADTTAAKK